MTGSPAQLRVLRETPQTSPEDEEAARPSVTALTGTGPDGGRLAHPATAGRPAPTLLDVENQLVGFVCDLVEAPATAVGTLTSGIAETALLVVQAARDARPTLRRPTMVLPESAHPAWFAAARTLGVVPLATPLDVTGRAAIGPLGTAVTGETVLMVASAASFTHGTVDPVPWLGAVATARGIPLHVDASAGGWTLAYAGLAGRVGPTWGFAVPGVASVSLDVGPDTGVPAEAGVLLHRSLEERRHVPRPGWPEQGSLSTWRPAGGVLADLAETLREVGHAGCARLALGGQEAAGRLVVGLADVRGVAVVSPPDATTVTLRADTTCDVFTLADELRSRGWSSQLILSDGDRPPLLRLTVTAAALPATDRLLADVAASVTAAQARGRVGLDPTIGKLLSTVDPLAVSPRSATLMLEAAAVLDPTASTHRLLDAAGPGVREALVSARHDLLHRPARRGTPRLPAHLTVGSDGTRPHQAAAQP